MKALKIRYWFWRSNRALRKSDRELQKAERAVDRAKGYTMDAQAWSYLANCLLEDLKTGGDKHEVPTTRIPEVQHPTDH